MVSKAEIATDIKIVKSMLSYHLDGKQPAMLSIALSMAQLIDFSFLERHNIRIF